MLSARPNVGSPTEGGAPAELESLGKSDRIVAYCLLGRGQAAQTTLVAATGLSRPTVAAALTRLTARGLAEMVPGQDDARTTGRRPHHYQLTARAGHAVGVDIGRRHITVVIMDAAHRQVIRLGSKINADADLDPLAVLKQAAEQVQVALEQSGDVSAVLGIGFGLPVPLTRDGTVASGTLLPAWAQVDPQRQLGALLPGFSVHVANEADLGALGEYAFGWGEGRHDLTYVKLGTGIGGGMVLGGRLHRSSGGPAMEIGHITMDYQGRRCPCGNRGCLERYVGGRELLASARNDGLEIEDLTSLVSRARAGDAACRRIIYEAASLIGIAVGTLANLNGPELVVLGGSLSAAGDLLTGPLRTALDQTAFAAATGGMTIKVARLGQWASACGATALVFDHLTK
ncbi:MAG TPA: ROK family transcriptional regulator [Trebonia sp.]|nr:ROK family transcriptional regulator [Trebonia sp.]